MARAALAPAAPRRIAPGISAAVDAFFCAITDDENTRPPGAALLLVTPQGPVDIDLAVRADDLVGRPGMRPNLIKDHDRLSVEHRLTGGAHDICRLNRTRSRVDNIFKCHFKACPAQRMG